MTSGAPTLSPDGLIVGGNGRFEGISQAYDGRTAAAYRAELERNAWRFGIDGNEVRAMHKPVLVRRVTADADTRQLAIQSNQPAGLQMSDMEQAALDAERMRGLERIAVSDTGDIPLTASNRQAIQHALGGYSTNEVAGMVGADGSLSQSGLRRVRNAILYRAYGKSETLARLIESPDADMKNVGTALVRAAGNLAQVRDGVADASIPAEFDIAADLTVAIETLSALRAEGANLGEFLAQADMFGGELTAAQTTIIRMLADNLRSAKNITAFLHDYAQQVMSLQDSANGLLGQMPAPSKEEVLDRARQQHTAPQRASAAPQLHARAIGGDREVQAGEGHRPDSHRQSGDEDAREAGAGAGAGESRAGGKQEGGQEGVGEAPRFNRSETTQQAYEQRIDALFAGAKPSLEGVRVLDRGDVLSLLGHEDKPVALAEGKVKAGMVNHPLITAEVWKKVPQWLENPAAVFDSETAEGLVFIAPETIAGRPVSIIVRPDAGHPNTLHAHVLLNTYERSANTPFLRWMNNGLLRFVDQKKFPTVLESTSGRRLPGTALQNKPGTSKILTEKNLAGWRKENAPQFNRAEDAAEQQFAETARVYGGHEAYEQAKAEGRTHLNYRQWVQVRTPAFKAWFGDWENDPENASKVVNAETGEPLVVYHGTAQDELTVFDLTRARQNADIPSFFFSTQKDEAEGYGDNVIAAFLNIRNPVEKPDADMRGTEVRRELEAQGVDGTMVEDEYSTEYAVFNPAQIKSATDNSGAFDAGNNDIRYSRSETTKAAYEQRIDELFAGARPGLEGVRVLDRSDMLGLLGMGDGPVYLAEGKVKTDKHPNMGADVWKKIPEWLDSPAAVFDSDTVQGRLVAVAPEMVNGNAVLMVLEPYGQTKADGVRVHLLQNAYDKDESVPPFGRWLREGKGRYVDQKKFPVILHASGLQLSGTAWQNKPGMPRILTEKNLAGWRKDQSLLSNRSSDTAGATHDNRIIRDDSPDTQRAVGLLNRFFEGRGGDPVSFQGVRTEGIDSVVPLAQALGAKVVGVKVREGLTARQLSVIERFNGARYKGYIYLDADTRRPHLAVLGHEMAHEMRAKRPDLYDRMVDAITPYIRHKEYGYWAFNDVVAKDVKDLDKKQEEFIGEVLSDGFMEPEFWRALGKKNKQLLVQVQNFLARMLQKIAATVGYTRKTEAYLTDYERVMQIAGEVMGEYGLDQGKFHRMAGIDARFSRKEGQGKAGKAGKDKTPPQQWTLATPGRL
ncbi:MAG: hypothetical protein Q4A11_06955, partial [Brachymonas sp.]|nr:hypothetical protein [Brachymonas sp.]